jgi:hypothetical protein
MGKRPTNPARKDHGTGSKEGNVQSERPPQAFSKRLQPHEKPNVNLRFAKRRPSFEKYVEKGALKNIIGNKGEGKEDSTFNAEVEKQQVLPRKRTNSIVRSVEQKTSGRPPTALEAELSFQQLKTRQVRYNETSLARQDPHRSRLPVSPRVLTFSTPLSPTKAKRLHKQAQPVTSTENFAGIIKINKKERVQRTKRAYRQVNMKKFDSLQKKANSKHVLEAYKAKMKNVGPPSRRTGSGGGTYVCLM